MSYEEIYESGRERGKVEGFLEGLEAAEKIFDLVMKGEKNEN